MTKEKSSKMNNDQAYVIFKKVLEDNYTVYHPFKIPDNIDTSVWQFDLKKLFFEATGNKFQCPLDKKNQKIGEFYHRYLLEKFNIDNTELSKRHSFYRIQKNIPVNTDDNTIKTKRFKYKNLVPKSNQNTNDNTNTESVVNNIRKSSNSPKKPLGKDAAKQKAKELFISDFQDRKGKYPCLLCHKNKLDFTDSGTYHMGHLVPKHKLKAEGKLQYTAANLFPICPSCNQENGTCDTIEYMKEKTDHPDFQHMVGNIFSIIHHKFTTCNTLEYTGDEYICKNELEWLERHYSESVRKNPDIVKIVVKGMAQNLTKHLSAEMSPLSVKSCKATCDVAELENKIDDIMKQKKEKKAIADLVAKELEALRNEHRIATNDWCVDISRTIIKYGLSLDDCTSDDMFTTHDTVPYL